MKKIIISIILIIFQNNIEAQNEIDTLYLYPDTTTFLNDGITVTENISNFAVKFIPPYGWDEYIIDKILIKFISTTINSLHFRISTGIIPEDKILLDSLSYTYIPENIYPEWQEIKIEPEILLKNLENIYISGEVIFFSARSYYIDTLIPNHYLYNHVRNEWNEGWPCYSIIKIVIKKTLTYIKKGQTPNDFHVAQNFPNPFNSNTKINFVLEKGGFVQLKIFDTIGKEKMQLINEYKEPGMYSIDFQPNNINSGFYLYILKVNVVSISKKMMYLK